MKICFVPWDDRLTDAEIFDNERLQQFFLLKKKLEKDGHQISTVKSSGMENADCVVFFDAFTNSKFQLKCIKNAIALGIIQNSIYCAQEPPVVSPANYAFIMNKWSKLFKKVLTVQSDLNGIGNCTYYSDCIDKTEYKDAPPVILNHEKKLLTAISGNKCSILKNELYSERIRAYRFFQKNIPDQFDFYGTGWNPARFPSYRGKCAGKQEVLSQYKFSICYENMCGINGYVTEKPIDVIKAGAVPIYKGAKNVDKYIPSGCMIYKDQFKSYQDLLMYIQNMPDSDYDKIISEQKTFLNGESFKRFSIDFYVNIMYNTILLEDLRSKLSRRELLQAYKAGVCGFQLKRAVMFISNPFRSIRYVMKKVFGR